MSKFKTILFTLIGLGLSGFFTLLLLEIGMRFLPVCSAMFSQPVTHEQPIARFIKNQDITWSKDWDFSIVARRHVNNDGFLNDQDYDPEDSRPLMAVIGDSYVEALMVPYDETIYGRLSQDAGDQKRVYSFGGSGAPLSQYLIWAKYARDTYKPDSMVFVIIGNDFDESLPQYAAFPTFHQFVEDENGQLKPKLLQEYHPSPLRNVFTYSALARYLFFNLKINNSYLQFKKKLLQKKNEELEYVNNVAAFTSEEKEQDSYEAISAFLDLLPEYAGLPADKIILAVDAPRRFIYEPDSKPAKQSYFEKMRDDLMEKGRKQGFQIIDLWPVMEEDYALNGKHFEYQTDWHWNGYGHSVASDEIKKTSAYKKFLSLKRPLIDD